MPWWTRKREPRTRGGVPFWLTISMAESPPGGGGEGGRVRLYVWDGVLTDYSSGIAFAMAESEEEARRVILEKAQDYEKDLLERDMAQPPTVYTEPAGFFL